MHVPKEEPDLGDDDEEQSSEEEENHDDDDQDSQEEEDEEENECESDYSTAEEEGDDNEENLEKSPCPVSIHGRAGRLQQAIELIMMNKGFGEDMDFSTEDLVGTKFANICRSTVGYKHHDKVEEICKVKAPVETFTVKDDNPELGPFTSNKRSSLSRSLPVREKLTEKDLLGDSEVVLPIVSKDNVQNEPSPVIQEVLEEPIAQPSPSHPAPSVHSNPNPQNTLPVKPIKYFKRGSGQNDFWLPTQPPRKLTTAEKERRDATLRANFIKFPYPEKFHPIVKGGSPWPGHSLTPAEMTIVKEVITID